MSIPQCNINWSAVEAIGTIAAAVVALALGLYGEQIRRWWRRPKKLELETGSELWHEKNRPGISYDEPDEGSLMWEHETVRIKVLNPKTSRGPAKEIRLRALHFFIGDDETCMCEDPVTLRWSASDGAQVHPCLSPSDYEYIDLFHLRRTSKGPCRLHISGSPLWLPQGKYRIELAVYSSTAAPDMRSLRVTFSHQPEGNPYYISVSEA